MVKKNVKTISYRLKFVDSERTMVNSLSNIVNNLEFKYVKRTELNIRIVSVVFNIQTLMII